MKKPFDWTQTKEGKGYHLMPHNLETEFQNALLRQAISCSDFIIWLHSSTMQCHRHYLILSYMPRKELPA